MTEGDKRCEVRSEEAWSASIHDEIIKRLMAGVGMPNSTSLYTAFKQFANELHALAHSRGSAPVAQASSDPFVAAAIAEDAKWPDPILGAQASREDQYRSALEEIGRYAKKIRKSRDLVGPAEYVNDHRAMKVWERALYHEGKTIEGMVKAGLRGSEIFEPEKAATSPMPSAQSGGAAK